VSKSPIQVQFSVDTSKLLAGQIRAERAVYRLWLRLNPSPPRRLWLRYRLWRITRKQGAQA
jgi:hypothetical protein